LDLRDANGTTDGGAIGFSPVSGRATRLCRYFRPYRRQKTSISKAAAIQTTSSLSDHACSG
jgi:hypothetical protein